jgi:Holliday junction DNA helicase RuvB
MNASTDTLEDEVEPFLLRSELLIRSPRGRVVTAKGYRHLKMSPPQDGPADPQQRLFETP